MDFFGAGSVSVGADVTGGGDFGGIFVTGLPKSEPVIVTVEEAPAKSVSGTATSGYGKGALWSEGYIQRTLFKMENGKTVEI